MNLASSSGARMRAVEVADQHLKEVKDHMGARGDIGKSDLRQGDQFLSLTAPPSKYLRRSQKRSRAEVREPIMSC